jgi:hypothetical protein
MNEVIKRILLLLAIAILVIIGLSYSQKYLYRFFISDYNRHALLNDVIKEKTNMEDNILLFGNSRTMFDIDASIIKDSIHYSGEIFNLASVNQTIYEASYYYAQIGNKTKMVVQCTPPDFFSHDSFHGLYDEVKAISMFLSGYRITEDTKKLIPEYDPYFDHSAFHNYLTSNSYFKAYIHFLIRPLLDNEKFDEHLRMNSYFPHIFTEARHPDYPVYNYNCEIYCAKEKPVTPLSFLKKVKNYFDSRGIEYILVLMPVNPDECKDCYQDFSKYTKMIEEETGIHVINLTEIIPEEKYWYEAFHANKNGARIVSNQLAKLLKTYYK